jgi:putative endonuclease
MKHVQNLNMYSKKRKFGNIGENFASKELVKLGFEIIVRNYLKPYGEIDIVARGTDGSIHFIEVKTMNGSISQSNDSVSRGTFFPEENVTREKLAKLERVVQAWLLEHTYDGTWSIDVMAITIDENKGIGKYKLIRNVY